MARSHSVEQSLPAPGCAPQLGDDMGLQRGDAEFIEMLVTSSCFAHSSAELHPRAPPTQHMMMEAFERGW